MDHKIVTKDQWLESRRELLEKEKEFTKLRDQLSQQRRDLPWIKVDKEYTFTGANGVQKFSDLFLGKSQLIVYHFMFDPAWKQGCKNCSFWADNFNNIIVHLNNRDANLVAIAKAPFVKLQEFHKRMNWEFSFYSSFDNDFNRDYHVSFTEEEKEAAFYNFKVRKVPFSEGPGISVFYKNANQEIFHTYSCYARGLDMLNGAYHYIDLLPKGRDEQNLSFPMAWVNLHDKYGQ